MPGLTFLPAVDGATGRGPGQNTLAGILGEEIGCLHSCHDFQEALNHDKALRIDVQVVEEENGLLSKCLGGCEDLRRGAAALQDGRDRFCKGILVQRMPGKGMALKSCRHREETPRPLQELQYGVAGIDRRRSHGRQKGRTRNAQAITDLRRRHRSMEGAGDDQSEELKRVKVTDAHLQHRLLPLLQTHLVRLAQMEGPGFGHGAVQLLTPQTQGVQAFDGHGQGQTAGKVFEKHLGIFSFAHHAVVDQNPGVFSKGPHDLTLLLPVFQSESIFPGIQSRVGLFEVVILRLHQPVQFPRSF
mmetsp:Transcript_50521/g.102858  ORF Transcript_50521/g.102858 Transcript_50521/m.102858 type:complete len:301 (-) Transcript_50521:306-1208(-)